MKTQFKGFDQRLMLSFGLLGIYVLMLVTVLLVNSCNQNAQTTRVRYIQPQNQSKCYYSDYDYLAYLDADSTDHFNLELSSL